MDTSLEGWSGRVLEIEPLPVEKWKLPSVGQTYGKQHIAQASSVCPRCGFAKSHDTDGHCQACAVELGKYRLAGRIGANAQFGANDDGPVIPGYCEWRWRG